MWRLIAPVALLMVVATTTQSKAAVLLIQGPAGQINQDCIPFGCGNHAQLLYQSSFFAPGPINITAITFFNSVFDAPDTFDPAAYTFAFSTTPTTVGTLSGTYASNVGTPLSTFNVTNIAAGPIPGSFTFSGGPYLYNPAAGNLLLDVNKPAGSNAFSAFTDNNSNLAGVGRVWNTNNGPTGNVDQNYAPVIQITFSPAAVPEPATLTVFGLGLLGAVGYAARRRKAAAA